MSIKIIKFYDTEIEEYEFHSYKYPVLISNIDINKIVVSMNFPFDKQGFQHFIEHSEKKKTFKHISSTNHYI